MFETFQSRLELTGTLTTVTALRISAGRSSEPIGSDLPVVKDALGSPLIPGASFKGAMRSRLESFLRGVNESFAIDPNELTSSSWQNQIRELKERFKDSDESLTAEILKRKNTDLISHLFGSPWLAGKLQIRDLSVQSNAWFGQYQERDGVAIDRDTETASDGKLYDFQVVPAGTPFEFKAVVENAKEWELGLLMIGLHQFETQQIPLGGGSSRGLGVVELQLDEMIWINPSNPQDLITYLQHLARGELQPYVKSSQEIGALKGQWSTALINKLNQETTDREIHA
ncbi:CRISPR-associated RAMP protein [Cyanobacteria bacterium FACHB-DQ100]|nr:CRISPR-associated RAMP protein [Cyanobacteria bacterium FACHB-DQ100]